MWFFGAVVTALGILLALIAARIVGVRVFITF
jgi:hypothetical protein